MAIQMPRNTGSALRLAQANRPDKRNFAVCGWAKLDTIVARVTSLFDYYQASPNFSWNGFVTNGNGSTMGWWSGNSKTDVTTITANEWFWWALRSNSTTTNMWFWTRSAGLITDSRANTLVAGTDGFFDIGDHEYDEPWDGPICAVKIFTASITDAEMLNEQWCMVPKAANKLHAWYPMLNSSLTDALKDFSGNGRNLTANGATQPTAVLSSPPVSYGAKIIAV